MKKIKAYLANQFGFSETGRYILETMIKPRIIQIGITINDPFEACSKELDLKHLSKLKQYEFVRNYWERFSKKVTLINNKLMQESDCLLAILDGGHAIDDGVASEIGYYAGMQRGGPIFALRSDIRGGENIGTLINPQVLGYIIQSGGNLATPPDAIEKWFKDIRDWYDSFTNSS